MALLDAPGPVLPHTGERFRQRRNFNLIASKLPIERCSGLSMSDPVEGFPEKYLVARIDLNGNAVEVHNAHTPPGVTVDMLKVEYWEAVADRIEQPTDAARVLCGDFNSPWSESDDGFVTGGDRPDPEEQARWKSAELRLLDHPELRDVYRANHVAGTPFPISYIRTPGTETCRYDRVYASEEFDLAHSRCEYFDDLLSRPPSMRAEAEDTGLSDHAPVLATLVLG